jgi:hypothetical protein
MEFEAYRTINKQISLLERVVVTEVWTIKSVCDDAQHAAAGLPLRLLINVCVLHRVWSNMRHTGCSCLPGALNLGMEN